MNDNPAHLAGVDGPSLEGAVRSALAPADPASERARFEALAAVVRGALEQRWLRTTLAESARRGRRVHYLSMEFLIGRTLTNAVDALGLTTACVQHAGGDAGAWRELVEQEPDAALGNGGLGRLAACFLDSLATLDIPAIGYGLRFRYGMFAQAIRDGRQVELPDLWLQAGDSWSIPRSDLHFTVGFGGRVEANGTLRRWLPDVTVVALAHDMVVPGHGTDHVATLRVWDARANEPLDFSAFAHGDYAAADARRREADVLTFLLYPDDSTPAGLELRLKQEYLLVSASLQDILARDRAENGTLAGIGRRIAIHLNDTHPALAVPELLRLLVDENGMSWDGAWAECLPAFSYTNHTLMPEALETWPVRVLQSLLPRHLELIYEINHRFLAGVRERFPGDEGLIARVSLIDEHGERRVKMAPLSIVASQRVNGVSKLHSDLMVRTIFADYARIFPDRFINVTNGVTPRRWVAQANPPLAALLDRRIGEGWRRDLGRLQDLAGSADDAELQAAVAAAKRANKVALATRLRTELGIDVDVDSLFDVQAKRFHEYKRQLLNILQVVARYQRIIAAPWQPLQPRTVIFSGKAATAYVAAKSFIGLIHDVARVVNTDPRVGGRLKVVFLPNYGVSVAEALIPAADLSQQISTAGTEASGTGNMKFALNGALTIGTWDGANIEIAEAAGAENLFIFGLKADEVARLRAGGYEPRRYVERDPVLKAVLDGIGGGQFSPGDPGRYRALAESLQYHDHYCLLADFASYVAAQDQVDRAFADRPGWTAKVIRNIAAMGWFSTDRTIAEYAQKVWNVPARPVS
ncbi:MAG TPA: glycogen/starch/alpha-glucan phosphorylase [Burkholderiaceae bacterium]|nr:glycogen/starch/alpha-glucan phosphorylase [Burkholderiaceae bacterium]